MTSPPLPPDTSAQIKFFGACIDSCAQWTIIGAPQSSAYSAQAGTDLTDPDIPSLNFKFGVVSYASRGTLKVRLLVMCDQFILITANIVALDVPRLLGLNALTQLKVKITFANDITTVTNGSWQINLVRK